MKEAVAEIMEEMFEDGHSWEEIAQSAIRLIKSGKTEENTLEIIPWEDGEFQVYDRVAELQLYVGTEDECLNFKEQWS